MKTTNQDKINHYLWHLWQIIKLWDSEWEDEYQELYDKVQKVKDTIDFKNFCIQKHDEWELQVGVLYLYFMKK